MLLSDRPILRPNQDLYRRSAFAATIARAIYNLTASKDGYAFAITGTWGTGKTSVLNLIERHLLHLQMESLSNTKLWWQEEVEPRSAEEFDAISYLYEIVAPQIAILLQRDKYLFSASFGYQLEFFRRYLETEKQVRDAILYWHLLDKLHASPAAVVVNFSPWLIAGRASLASALLSELGRCLGKYLGPSTKQAFRDFLQRLSEFAPVAGAGLDLAAPTAGLGPLVRAAGGLSRSTADKMVSGPTLDELRTELRNSLSRLNDQRVLVIVDDVDRLTPTEAAEMVGLIKSLGDLPNVVYLLSYDRVVVSDLLTKALTVEGGKYLEKIVQQHVELPPISDDDLIRAANAEIVKIFAKADLTSERTSVIWHRVLKHYIRTPRDARRYFNSLELAQPGLAEFTDPGDLMLIQALQVFEPDIYLYVRDHLTEMVG